MKNVDVKSLLIGALLTSTIFLGVAAVEPANKNTAPKEGAWQIAWHYTDHFYKRSDDDQTGANVRIPNPGPSNQGWEPFAVTADGKKTFSRKHIK